jgi:hypothetical protein
MFPVVSASPENQGEGPRQSGLEDWRNLKIYPHLCEKTAAARKEAGARCATPGQQDIHGGM